MTRDGVDVTAEDKTEQFVQHLTEHQTRLYGYVYSLLGNLRVLATWCKKPI
ncbi:MAG: hypothetical protein ACF787_06180 [Rhodopirellula sp. JB053]